MSFDGGAIDRLVMALAAIGLAVALSGMGRLGKRWPRRAAERESAGVGPLLK